MNTSSTKSRYLEGVGYRTLLNLPGSSVPIGHIATSKNGTFKLYTLGYEPKDNGDLDRIDSVVCRAARFVARGCKMLKIVLDNGSSLVCTEGQKLLTLDIHSSNGLPSWKEREAQQLKPGEWLKSLGTDPKTIKIDRVPFRVFRKVLHIEAVPGYHDAYGLDLVTSPCYYGEHLLLFI